MRRSKALLLPTNVCVSTPWRIGEGVPHTARSLIYSFVGYVFTEEKINGRGQIIVALDSVENNLEEVEVIPTDCQARETIGYLKLVDTTSKKMLGRYVG